MEISIRSGSPEDAGTISGFVTALTEEICAAMNSRYFNLDLEETTALCRTLMEQNRYVALLAFVQNEPVGVATLSEGCALYVGGALATVQEVYVVPEKRSQRIGAALMASIHEMGVTRQWKAIELCTPPLPEFERSIKFYEGQGFRVVGGRKMRMNL